MNVITSEFWRCRSQVKLCQIAQSFAVLSLHRLLNNRLLKSREKFRQLYLQFFKALARRDSRLSRRKSRLSRRVLSRETRKVVTYF